MNGYDLTTPDATTPLPDETLRSAALTVCRYAHTTDEAHDLLGALGLLEVTG